MAQPEEFRIGVRVEDRVGNRGTVIMPAWITNAGYVCTIAWDSQAPSASGSSDERVVNLTIVR